MRKLFLALFIPVLFILGTPALIATIMYDGSGDVHMPVHLYTEDADAEEMLYAELKTAFDNVQSGATNDAVLELHQDIINTAIFQAIREQNPDYMPTEDCDDVSCAYIVEQEIPIEGFLISLRVVGIWVDFGPDKVVSNIFVEVNFDSGFTYKTIIETHFILKDEVDRYYLEFDKIQLGNLPIPKSLISTVLGMIDDQVDQFDLEEDAAGIPIGTIDFDDISLTIMKEDIILKLEEELENQQSDDESGAALAGLALGLVFDENEGLLGFEFVEDELLLTVKVSKIRNDEDMDIPDYLYDLHYKTIVEEEEVIGDFNPDSFDPESYLEDKFTEYVFNYALAGGGFSIDERFFNKMIYHTAGGFVDTRETYSLPLEGGEVEDVSIGLRAIWFEFTPNDIYVNALFEIAGINSLIQIRVNEVSESDTELVFELAEITVGYDSGEADGQYILLDELDAFKDIFAKLGDVEFGVFDEFGVLTINIEILQDLMQDGSQADVVTVEKIELVQGAIMLDVVPNAEFLDEDLVVLLDTFSTEIITVISGDELLIDLAAAMDTTTGTPGGEVFEAIELMQTILTDGDEETNVDAELVTDLFENFELLETEEQEAFLLTFEALIDEDVLALFDQYFDDDPTPPTP